MSATMSSSWYKRIKSGETLDFINQLPSHINEEETCSPSKSLVSDNNLIDYERIALAKKLVKDDKFHLRDALVKDLRGMVGKIKDEEDDEVAHETMLDAVFKEQQTTKHMDTNDWDPENEAGILHPLQLTIRREMKHKWDQEVARGAEIAAKKTGHGGYGSGDVLRPFRYDQHARPALEIVTKIWEESQLRPPSQIERPCKNGRNCQGVCLAASLPDADAEDGFTLVRFSTPEGGYAACFQKLCVLCLRMKVTMDWHDMRARNMHVHTVTQPYRNLVGTVDEYAQDCTIPIIDDAFYGICDPFVLYRDTSYGYMLKEGVVCIYQRKNMDFGLAPSVRTSAFPRISTFVDYAWRNRMGPIIQRPFRRIDIHESGWRDIFTDEYYDDEIADTIIMESTSEFVDFALRACPTEKKLIAQMVILDILLFSCIDIKDKMILENELECVMAGLSIKSREQDDVNPNIVEPEHLQFGLYRLPDVSYALNFCGIVGVSYYIDTLPIVELMTRALPQKNQTRQFPKKCELLCYHHIHVRKWISSLYRCSLGGFYSHCNRGPDLNTRFQLMELFGNGMDMSNMVHFVCTYPVFTMFCVKEYIIYAVRMSCALYKSCVSFHYNWEAFDKSMKSAMESAREDFYQHKSMDRVEALLVEHQKKRQKKLFKVHQEWFWEKAVKVFASYPDISARRLEAVSRDLDSVKLFDARHAYSGFDAVMATVAKHGYSDDAVQLIRDLKHSYDEEKADRVFRSSIMGASMDSNVEAFIICSIVFDSFKIRQIQLPHHWNHNHTTVDNFGVTGAPKLYRGTTFVCPTCHEFKGFRVYTAQEAIDDKLKEKDRVHLDRAVLACGHKSVSYDIVNDRYACFKKKPNGRSKDIALALKKKQNQVVKKPRKKKLEISIGRKRDCIKEFVELVPMDLRGNAVECYGKLYSKCWRCGAPCCMNAVRGCDNVFKCMQCDKITNNEIKCELCGSRKKNGSKLKWSRVVAYDKEEEQGSSEIWLCHKDSPDWIHNARIWNYTILLERLGNRRKTGMNTHYRAVKTIT
jgi:hypothetical protein